MSFELDIKNPKRCKSHGPDSMMHIAFYSQGALKDRLVPEWRLLLSNYSKLLLVLHPCCAFNLFHLAFINKLPHILICNRFEQKSNEIYFGIIHACIQVYVGSQWLIIVFQGQTEARLFHEWPKYFLHIGVQISFVLCHLYINKIYPLLT